MSKDLDIAEQYMKEINRIPLLSREEELKYARLVLQGDAEARNKMCEHNLRLVAKIAQKYIGKGLEFMDLVQEGNIGLTRAVDKYNPEKGYKFSTYATFWIRQGITRALTDQSRMIKIPAYMQDKISKLRKTSAKLMQEFGREPTDEEIAEQMGLSIEDVEEMHKYALDTISLESPLGDSDNTLAEMIADTEGLPIAEIEEKMAVDNIREYMQCLTDKERQTLTLRFGMGTGNTMTLEEVGNVMNLTRERVRQIESEALKKMRNVATRRL